MTQTAKENSARNMRELLNRIASQPTTGDLWALRGALLARQDAPGAQQAHAIAREFYLYLSELQSKLDARQYNELASRLDVGAIGMLALQDILLEKQDLWKNLLLGGLGEGMMVLASRQYIKAWERELVLTHRRAAWTLYDALWKISRQLRPEQAEDERQALIEASLAPVLDDATALEAKMLLLLRLFQTTLLTLIAPLCSTTD